MPSSPCSGPGASPKRLPKAPAPPPAGRCHGGTGRENNAPPTPRSSSLCGGLWVSASPDIIQRWDPDVRPLRWYSAERENQTLTSPATEIGRSLFPPPPPSSEVTGDKLMAQSLRRDVAGEQRKQIRSVRKCLTCLTGEDTPGDQCQSFTASLRGHPSLSVPAETSSRKTFSWRWNEAGRPLHLLLPVRWPGMKNDPLWFLLCCERERNEIDGRKTLVTSLYFSISAAFHCRLFDGWSLKLPL